jgi:protein-tyrosine kinase
MANEPHLMVRIRRIQDDQMTGLLELEKEDDKIAIYFHEGLIDGAGSNVAQLQLGRILAKRGNLESTALPKLLETVQHKGWMLGKAAVACKLLDDAELKDGVRDQIVQVLTHAMQQEFVVRAFKDEPVDLFMPARLNYDRLMLELARGNLRPMQLDPNRLISLSNGHSLSHLPWYPQELSVLSHLNTPCTLRDLAAATGMEYTRLTKILYVFNVLKLIRQVDVPASESTALIKREGFPFEHLTPEIGSANLSDKLETFHNASSFISEQFRTLKVRIAEMAAQAPLRVIAVSSPHTQDGKSVISVNLGVSFSNDPGRRVVLVDCDMRNPSIHKLLGTSVEPGLLGYLENDYLQPYCYMRRLEKLYLMTAGGISSNPVELLSHAKMRELIGYLKTEFDTIILDCPPYGPISDAHVLAGLADGLLMVVRCGKTTYGTIEKAFRNIDRSKLIGLVFNDVKPMMFNTQYPYKYYHYRHRDHYPYGQVQVSKHSKTYLE